MTPRNRTILLVEDDDDDVQLTLRAFRNVPIVSEMVVVRDGLEALDYLLGSDSAHAPLQPLPEVVLLDLNLPRMHGIDVLRRLRAQPRTKTLPIVVLTSSTDGKDIVSSYELGANSYIRKPVDFAEFVDAARHLGLYWLQLNEPASTR